MLHGRLRVGVSRPVDRRLAQTLGAFHRAHPAIEIVFTEQHNDPLLDALAAGDLDAAVVGMHGRPLPPQIRTRVIAIEPLVLVVPHDHPLDHRTSISLSHLREQPMITLTHGSGLRTVLEGACHAAGFTLRIVAETSELGSVVELVAEGLGLAVLPRSAIGDTDLGVAEIARPRLQRRTALAWNHATATPAARAFLSLAEQHLPATTLGPNGSPNQ